MSRVVILGAGISGHAAAAYARKWLGRGDTVTRAHVSKVEKDRVYYETLDGAQREQEFDFAMLLPPFSGVGLRAYGRDGSEITDRLFLPNDFMRVDADYTARPYEK